MSTGMYVGNSFIHTASVICSQLTLKHHSSTEYMYTYVRVELHLDFSGLY